MLDGAWLRASRAVDSCFFDQACLRILLLGEVVWRLDCTDFDLSPTALGLTKP